MAKKKKAARKAKPRAKAKKASSKGLISGSMTIADTVNKYPQTAEIFMQHGMGCFGCGVAQFETIEQGAAAHGIDAKPLLKDLKKAAKKK